MKIYKELQEIIRTVESHSDYFFFTKHKKERLFKALHTELSSLQQYLTQIEQRLPNIETLLSDKIQHIHQLSTEKDQLMIEQQHLQLQQNIIASLLNSRNQNEGVKQYFHLLHNDFLAFANDESSLKEEASALLKLQELGKELELVGNYPDFHHKRTLAVAGGFSAGKSRLISSLFGDSSVKLPSDVKPTTAIPTYVMHAEQTRLLGVSSQGGVVDLHQLDSDLHHQLSHEFINSFGFNLKTILPNLFLTTPMEYEHLCFIDTPGYNAAGSSGGYTDQDVQTAKDFTHQAEAVLWLIGLDANGTISDTDCDFLSEIMADEEKPLYIVLNKAELKPLSDVEDIIKQVVETLEDRDIEFAGVSAYSALLKKEISYHKQPIMQFIKQLDQPSDKHRELLTKLYEVDLMYQKAIWAEISEYRELARTFKNVALDLYEQDVDEYTYEKVDNLRKRFDTHTLKQQLKQLGVVMGKLRAAVDSVFARSIAFERVELSGRNYKKEVDLKNSIIESEYKWYDPFTWGDNASKQAKPSKAI